MDLLPEQDNELKQLLQTDADRALTLLFEQYYSLLCLVATRILKSETLAEDLVQEVFYELWRKRKRLNIKGGLQAYLRSAVRNRSLNYIRDQRLQTVGEEALDNMSSAPQATQLLEVADLQKQIDEVIDQLPERCRLVFVLSRFEEMSHAEIASALNISPKTVENQMTKALKSLRNAILPRLSIWWGLFVSYLTNMV